MLQYLTLYLLLCCNILQYDKLFIDKLFISFLGMASNSIFDELVFMAFISFK